MTNRAALAGAILGALLIGGALVSLIGFALALAAVVGLLVAGYLLTVILCNWGAR